MKIAKNQIFCVISGVLCFMALPVGPLLGSLGPYIISQFSVIHWQIISSGDLGIVNIIGDILISCTILIFPKRLFGIKFFIFIGSLYSSCILFASYCQNYLWFFAFYLLSYVASSIIYQGILATFAVKINKNENLSKGFILAGFSFGLSIATYFSLWFFNPNNKKTEKFYFSEEKYFAADVAHMLPSGLRIISFYFFALILISQLIVSITTRKQNQNTTKQEENIEKKEHKSEQLLTEALTKKHTQQVCAINFLSLAQMHFLSVYWKQFGQSLNYSDKFLTTIKSIGFVFNSTSKPFWGMIFDCFPIKIVFTILFLLAYFTTIIFTYFSTNQIFYSIAIIMQAFVYAGILVGLTSLPFTIVDKSSQLALILSGVGRLGWTFSNVFIVILISLNIHYQNIMILFSWFILLAALLVWLLPKTNGY